MAIHDWLMGMVSNADNAFVFLKRRYDRDSFVC